VWLGINKIKGSNDQSQPFIRTLKKQKNKIWDNIMMLSEKQNLYKSQESYDC